MALAGKPEFVPVPDEPAGQYVVDTVQLTGDHAHQAVMLQEKLNRMAGSGYEYIDRAIIDTATHLLVFVKR
jgi:hypothetical protein